MEQRVYCDKCHKTFADFDAFYRHCTKQVDGVGRCPGVGRLLTTREVADRLRVDTTSVRRWVKDGKLEVASTTPGGQFRFSEEDIAALGR